MRKSAPTDRVGRVLEAALELGRSFVQRVLEMEGIDRAIVLAAQAFTALFPLLILYGTLVTDSGGNETAQWLIDRFELDGRSAETIETLFAAPVATEPEFQLLGVLLVFLSATSFARAMQRLYEHAWQVPRQGMRATGWGLVWLAGLLVWLSLQPAITGLFDGPFAVAVSMALGCGLWLITPYLLLGRRIGWRRLAPGAILTTAAMTLAGVVSVLVMPRALTQSADEFGTIGIAFALISWLTTIGFVLMATAAAGAVVAGRTAPYDPAVGGVHTNERNR